VHIWREEYPVEQGRIVGHEPVGTIHRLGDAVSGYEVGDRVLVGAITPCGTCFYCQNHNEAQCSGYEDEWRMIGGWQLGNSIDGVQAEYFRVPYAQANMAKIPDDLTDEQCVLLADIASTGISAAETAGVRIGQTVAVFAQGPIGLCATAGARLMGASLVIGVDRIAGRLELAKKMGASAVVDLRTESLVDAVFDQTRGRGVDVAIDAAGSIAAINTAIAAARVGGQIVMIGIPGENKIPVDVLGAIDKELNLQTIRRSNHNAHGAIELLQSGRIPGDFLTHHYPLDQTPRAFQTLAEYADGVGKVVIDI